MPGMDGVDFTRRVKEGGLNGHIIMLALFDECLSLAMDAGASGYLLNDIKRRALVEVIWKANRGQIVITNSITRPTAQRVPVASEERAGKGESARKQCERWLSLCRSATSAGRIIRRGTVNGTGQSGRGYA